LELLTEELVTDMSEQGRNYLESVHHIRNASSIAVEILNDLLQYDKLQDNTLHLQKKSIPALEIINDVVSTFRLQASI
jgi:signal transduction histidine kinase